MLEVLSTEVRQHPPDSALPICRCARLHRLIEPTPDGLDLHLGNVLLRFPTEVSLLSPDEIYETHRRTDQSGIARRCSLPHRRSRVARSTKRGYHPGRGICSHNGFPRIFSALGRGEALLQHPKTIRPPEARFLSEQQHATLSYPIDIWTLACSIWTVLGQRPLFDISCFTEDDVTKEQVDALGRLPDDW